MIAHHETSQTNLIAILALVFAPASPIAGIFSAGTLVTTNKSWIHYALASFNNNGSCDYSGTSRGIYMRKIAKLADLI
ncbi:hypothetical protein BFJ69_g16396 [Fusarium oxysporum]|uniref:Uncharacterized protein n=1 Tax=Fusarium oxysporum TaxID=5507 RepID=A0A420MBD7_FUSOX|nr:hypothetical protein BFJ69_g16396 [Fusarium oxysporum]